jgi:hypothetical protein
MWFFNIEKIVKNTIVAPLSNLTKMCFGQIDMYLFVLTNVFSMKGSWDVLTNQNDYLSMSPLVN